MGGFREHDRKPGSGKYPKKPLAGSVRPIIGRVENTVLEIVPVSLNVRNPFLILPPGIFAYRLAVLVQVSLAHKFLYVLNLNVVGLQGFDVSEEVFRQRSAVCITGLPALCLAEIGAFERSP